VTGASPSLVDIVREFLSTCRAVRRLLDRFRSGELRFEEVKALFGDQEASTLFRLKERCHALFRSESDVSRAVGHRELLFDLAVGSLFHEAMKFRENFYQREVYGPRARALHDEAEEENEELFREFEKIQVAVSARLEEGLQETEALVEKTREQLVVLLAANPDDGHVARYLTEQSELVEEVFVEGLDEVLRAIYGAATSGYELAGDSYLASGYYGEAEAAFAAAVERGGDPEALAPHSAYARGMAAYLAGHYARSVEELGRWAAGGAPGAPSRAELAHTAVSKLDRLLEDDDRERILAAAAALLEQLSDKRPDIAATA